MAIEDQLIDGLYVEYQVGQDGRSRYPLLFVHGAWSGSWMFANYLDYLASGGWNVFAMNLRGHYRSAVLDLSGVTLEDYANDVVRIARQMPAPPILIGFGTGAHIVQLALGKDSPAAGAVFMSAKLSDATGTVPPEVLKMPLIIPADPVRPAPDIDAETLAWMNEMRANTIEPRSVLVSLLRGRIQLRSGFVQVPYLVLNGEWDEDITADEGQELASFYEGPGTLEVLPKVSHTGVLLGQDWDEGANAINAWLGTNGFERLK